MTQEQEKTVFCKLEDDIVCPYCGATSKVKELEVREGNTLPKPGGGFDHTQYLHCHSCKDNRPLVFNWDSAGFEIVPAFDIYTPGQQA